MSAARTSRLWRALAIFAAVFLVATVCAEGAARVYVYRVAQRGKIFRSDPVLGWSVLSGLDLVRLNADRQPWRITTDEHGQRGNGQWRKDAERRVLILGDSFAFGEGVELGDRLDAVLVRALTTVTCIDLGTMGFGTDQQLLAGRSRFAELEAGDVVVLLTYGNDFHDVLRERHSGRSKPHFHLTDDGLVHHPPQIGWREGARESSYLVAFAMMKLSLLGIRQVSHGELEKSAEVYRRLVHGDLRRLAARGVHVVIAHHGDGAFPMPFDVARLVESVCAEGGYVDLALDELLDVPGQAPHFLGDGHWNAAGHRIAGQALAATIRAL